MCEVPVPLQLSFAEQEELVDRAIALVAPNEDDELSDFFYEVDTLIDEGKMLSNKQIAILSNVVTNHEYSKTIITAARVCLSSDKVKHLLREYNMFGALLKEQAASLLIELNKWVNSQDHEKRHMLSYRQLAEIK